MGAVRMRAFSYNFTTYIVKQTHKIKSIMCMTSNNIRLQTFICEKEAYLEEKKAEVLGSILAKLTRPKWNNYSTDFVNNYMQCKVLLRSVKMQLTS